MKEEASAEVSAYKLKYKQKQEELQASIDAANEREQQARKVINEEAAYIDELAENKLSELKTNLKRKNEEKTEKQNEAYERKKRKLESEYKIKTDSLYLLTFGGILYSIIVTILTGLNSPRFSRDISAVFKLIAEIGSFLWELSLMLASSAWSIKEMIPYTFIDVLVPILLIIVGFLVIFGGGITFLGAGLFNIGKFCAEFYVDDIGIFVSLVSLALIIWFADLLPFITWNLVLVFLIINFAYVIIRILLTSPNKY